MEPRELNDRTARLAGASLEQIETNCTGNGKKIGPKEANAQADEKRPHCDKEQRQNSEISRAL